jgi:hypothetical protein
MRPRAEADPFFARPQVAEFVHSYHRPETSTGFAPPGSPFRRASVRIHVGSDEVLLFMIHSGMLSAFAAGIDTRVDVDRDATRVRRQRRKVEGRCAKRWMPSARFSLRDGRLALDR